MPIQGAVGGLFCLLVARRFSVERPSVESTLKRVSLAIGNRRFSGVNNVRTEGRGAADRSRSVKTIARPHSRCKMEQYRFSDSETATPADSPLRTGASEPGSPCSLSGDGDILRSLGDSAASLLISRGDKSGRRSLPELSVVRGYDGATVLLTGATGYVGALVLEQLFRTCPGVHKVYLVIRGSTTRNGTAVSAEDRLRKLLAGPEFQALHSQLKSVLARIKVIAADLATPGLGLTEDDRLQLCLDTNYVIHCAASIRFDEPISTIMRTNYACTRGLLELAKGMRSLRCFTYMSTAYVNSNQPKHSKVREEIYPLPGTDDPFAVAQQLLDLPEKKASKLAAKLMEQWGLQNTYFVAKTLSERLVQSFDQKPFPVCIVRPSLIGCVAGDPFPGFIGNTSGFTGLVLGSLAGIIRFVQHDPNHRIAVVPGDVVSSATLAATVATWAYPGLLSNIVHICSSESYPLFNKVVHSAGASYLTIDPVQDHHKTLVRNGKHHVAWVKSRAAFKLRCTLRGVKLASIAAVLRMSGNSRQAKKMMMGHKIWTQLGIEDVDYNFTFKTPSTEALLRMLPDQERTLIKPVWREDLGDSWLRYLRTYTAGVKHLYMKEAPTQTDQQDYRPR